MENESGILAIRQRSSMEAIDQGLLMLRIFGRRLYPLVLIPMAVFGALTMMVVPWPWLQVLVLWWIKPLWDRLAVIPASRLVFHPESYYSFLLKQLLKMPLADLLSELTWRRFSPYRAVLLPPRLLEGLRGETLSTRLKVLVSRNQGMPILLSAGLLAAEWVLFFSFFPLLGSLFPGLQDGLLFQSAYMQPCAGVILYLFCQMVVEPYFALAGFGLYLNSRTQLEGWDLALVFRSLGRKAGKTLVAVMGFLFFASAAGELNAAPVPALSGMPTGAINEMTGDEWHERAHEILSGRDFGVEQEVPVLEPRKASAEEPPGEVIHAAAPGWFSSGLSTVLLYVLAGACAILLVGLVISMFRGKWSSATEACKDHPADLAVLSAARNINGGQSLAGWQDRALQLWADGQEDEALALLYRVNLDALASLGKLHIPDSATEEDCVRLLRKHAGMGPVLMEIFLSIVQARTRSTYAMLRVETEEFRKLGSGLEQALKGGTLP